MIEFLKLPQTDLSRFGESKRLSHQSGHPFPHTVLDGFFDAGFLSEVVSEFPDLKQSEEIENYRDAFQIKLASKGEALFGPKTRQLMHFLNSETFLYFLEGLTGIRNLIPDPHFFGGGLHQILPGGYLKIHSDFRIHPLTQLDRRLNLLIYLNNDWPEAYGGHLELWDKEMKACSKSILPIFNRMVIFDTDKTSFHGHPEPLRAPKGRSRKSLALYYYSNGRPEILDGLEEYTLFQRRPGSKDLDVSVIKNLVRPFVPPILVSAIKKMVRI